MDKWEGVSPLRFTEISRTSRTDADILINFVRGDHGDGSTFDRRGGRIYLFIMLGLKSDFANANRLISKLQMLLVRTQCVIIRLIMSPSHPLVIITLTQND